MGDRFSVDISRTEILVGIGGGAVILNDCVIASISWALRAALHEQSFSIAAEPRVPMKNLGGIWTEVQLVNDSTEVYSLTYLKLVPEMYPLFSNAC